MAINFTRLFTTLGKILGGLNEANASRFTTLNARIDTIDNRFETVFQDEVGDLYTQRDQAYNSFASLATYYQTLAGRVLIAEVTADNAAVAPDANSCLLELRRQMAVAGESLQNAALSTAITSVFLNGSIATPPTGYAVNNLLVGTFDETFVRPDRLDIRASVGSDSGGIPYNEIYNIKGNEFPYTILDARWPAGENLVTTLQQIDPMQNDWFVAEPTADGWTGVKPGTTGAAVDVRGFSAITFTKASAGGGDNFLVLEQPVGTAMRPNTWYCAYILVKQNSSQPLGVLVELKAGVGASSYGENITASRSFTVGSAPDRWQTVGCLFRTKAKLPENPYLSISLTANGSAVTVQACYPNMTATRVLELYPLGPCIALLSSSYPASVTNLDVVTVPDQTSPAQMVRGLERLFSASQVLGEGWPVSGTPTQADSLIS